MKNSDLGDKQPEDHSISDDPSIDFNDEERQIFSAINISDNDIVYPKHDEWQNLGKSVREKVAKENRAFRILNHKALWALAATIMVIIGITALYVHYSPTPTLVADAVPTGNSHYQAETESAADIAQVEMLMIQTEIDLIALESDFDFYADTTNNLDDHDMLPSNDIEDITLLEEYIDAL